MLPMKELQNYEEYQRSNIDSHENVDPNDYFADVDNHENVDPNDYVAENPSPSELPSCSSSTSLIPTTKHSSPNISASSNFAISSSPDIFANKSSPENSSTSNLEMLTSLAAQLANASADGSIPSQGLQFEEIDPARYTSEPAYIEEVDLARYTSEPAYIEEVDLERYTSEPAYIEEVDLTRYTSKPAYVQSDVKPSYRDEMFDPLELEPCNEDVEMVDAATTEEGRVYVEPRANLVHSVSCGEDVEEINAQHQRKIKGENTKMKGRKQKKNLKSDQPAKLPPLPAESELFDDSDPEPEMQRRKKKSLAVLAEKMLSMFPMVEMDSVIQLDKTADSLGADLRRLYTIVDVFEALHIMSRVGMNLYKWHGSNYLIQTLVWLREIAVCMGVPEQYELVKESELEAILKSAEYKISEEARLHSPSSIEPPAPSPSAATVSAEFNCKYSGSTSVGINTQLFLMLMLVAPHPKTLTLQFAAKVLQGSSKHNPQRRFLDIANILSSLGLIQKVKVTSGQGLRNAYQYSGPCVENMEITESIKKSIPSSSQKNSLLPYPKPPQNANNKKEVLKNGKKKKRGCKVGSKKEIENCTRIKNDAKKKVGVREDKRKKRRGRKLRQKNAKKLKVEVIIDEIIDSVINEIIETPKIVKKKRGRKLGSKKNVVANYVRTDVNKEIIVKDENSKKKLTVKADVEIITEILNTVINEVVETPKIVKKKRGRKLRSKKKVMANYMRPEDVNKAVIVEDESCKKKRGRKPKQKNAQVRTETGIVEILDTDVNVNFETPKIVKNKQGRKVGYRNANKNHKTEGKANKDTNGDKNCSRKLCQNEKFIEIDKANNNKNQIEMSMDLLENRNTDINSDKANRHEKNVPKSAQKMKGRALSESVVNDKKIVKVNIKKPRKRKIDQKAEETKSKVNRVQELVQKMEVKGMIIRAVNGEQILEINNKESNQKKIDQKVEETKSKGKRVRELGIRRSSRILKKERDDLNDLSDSTGEKKVEKERETEKEELFNYLKLAACHASV